MKKIHILITILLFSGSTLFAQSVDSLVSKYVAVTGGEKLYNGIDSYTLSWSSDDSKVPYDQTLMISEKLIIQSPENNLIG